MLAVAVLLLAGCASGSGGNSAPSPPPRSVDGVPIGLPDVAGGSATGVSLTPQTVMVDRATVAKSLVHISGDGTYTFTSATGALAAIAPGKVMLLQGTDVARVTAVESKGGQLVVHTSPVSIPEVIQSGQFHYRGPLDFSKAIVAPVVDSPSPASARSPMGTTTAAWRPGEMTAVAAPATQQMRLFDQTASLTVNGELDGGWRYTAGMYGDKNGLNVKISLTLKRGSVAGEVSLKAYLEMGNTNFDMTVADGQVSQGGFSASSLNGKWKLEYGFGQGESVDGIIDFPVLKIPFSWDIPWTLGGGIPMMLKVRQALIVKLGLSSKNATVKGGVEYTMGGQGGMTQSGPAAVPAEGTGGDIHGEVLGQNAGNVSISPAPSGVVVELQVKVGPGLGIRQANAVYYFDVVTSIGQTTASAIALMICSSYTIDVTLGGGFEASVGFSEKFSLGVTTPRTVLHQFPIIHSKEAGCPSTS